MAQKLYGKKGRKKEETGLNEEAPSNILAKSIMILLFLFMIIVATNFMLGYSISCQVHAIISSDKYCNLEYPSNYSRYPGVYKLRSHQADKEAQERRQAQRMVEEEQKKIEQQCYNEGYDFNKSYDIILDYGLSCKKIAYINDHLIDKKENGGYIEGSYSGFFSHGYIEGKFDVVKESLAIGQLVKVVSYHVNCRNETLNKQTEYYDEAEFITYYVKRCL